jgi:hypothetical protein
MTGNNSGATDVDLIRNEGLTKQIRDLLNSKVGLSEDQVVQFKLYAFHRIRSNEYECKLNSMF